MTKTEDAPVVVVSSDTHIGPLLSQLREYCPEAYLEQFDEFAAAIAEQKNSERVSRLRARNQKLSGSARAMASNSVAS